MFALQESDGAACRERASGVLVMGGPEGSSACCPSGTLLAQQRGCSGLCPDPSQASLSALPGSAGLSADATAAPAWGTWPCSPCVAASWGREILARGAWDALHFLYFLGHYRSICGAEPATGCSLTQCSDWK